MIKLKNKSNITTQHNHRGFTLAETLITLVIVGVVAALTVPTLIAKYQKEQTATKLKKVYSTITQSISKAIADHGPIKTWDVENNKSKEFVEKYLAPYLNVGKDCEYGTTGDCRFEWAYLNAPSTKSVHGNTYYKLILADGSVIMVRAILQDGRVNGVTIPIGRATIIIDINGQKGPNVFGKDIFHYEYWIKNDRRPVGPEWGDYSGTFEPSGGNNHNREYYMDIGCKQGGTGDACAALIMADSWQLKDDYPW